MEPSLMRSNNLGATYNIRLDLDSDAENSWTKRKDLWVSQVRFYSPDLLGIQEARPNQVLDIASNLPAFAYVGIGRDENNTGESSNIFYKKSASMEQDEIKQYLLKKGYKSDNISKAMEQ